MYDKAQICNIATPFQKGPLAHPDSYREVRASTVFSMSFCYILFSPSLNRFYIGSTQKSIETRLFEHVSKFFEGSFTSSSSDWELFHSISCENYRQALKIEKHLKKMKSKTYLKNLKKHPEIAERLLVKYKV